MLPARARRILLARPEAESQESTLHWRVPWGLTTGILPRPPKIASSGCIESRRNPSALFLGHPVRLVLGDAESRLGRWLLHLLPIPDGDNAVCIRTFGMRDAN